MYKVSLNKEHPQFDLFKAGLSFRSSDGKNRTRDGLPFHTLKESESVITSDVPDSVIGDSNLNKRMKEKGINRFVVENVDEKKEEKTKKGV